MSSRAWVPSLDNITTRLVPTIWPNDDIYTMQYFTLNNLIILNVSGADCRRYLNARLTNEIKNLLPGQGCQAAALNPQGKTQAFFTIICLADKEFLLLCDGGNKEVVINVLKQYIVADRVTVADLSATDLAVHIITSPSDEILFNSIIGTTTPQKLFDHLPTMNNLRILKNNRSKTGGFDIIGKRKDADALIALLKENAAEEISSETQQLLRFKSGIPSFPQEINENSIFSAANLENAISFKKGCYVGQEVIEKVAAYGKIPKLIKSLKVQGQIEFNGIDKVLIYLKQLGQEPKSVGNILSSCYDKEADCTYCFAEIKNDTAILSSTLDVQNHEAQLINLGT